VLHPDGSETLVVGGKGIVGAAPSRDSRSIVFSKAGSLYSVPAAGGTPTLVLGADRSAHVSYGFPNWSPSGDLRFVRSGPIRTSVMSMKPGMPARATIDLGRYAVESLSWSPDGSRIAFTARHAGSSPALFLLGSDGSGLRRLTSGPLGAAEVTWSPDGSQIAYLEAGENLVVATPDGTRVARFPVAYACCGLAWNPAPSVTRNAP
jgi:Tol biopolymer transport system component